MIEELDRKTQPEIKPIDDVQLLKPKKHLLDNGIPCFEIHGGGKEVVRIDFRFPAGLLRQKEKLVATFVNNLMFNGTSSYSAEEISDLTDHYGVQLQHTLKKGYAYITFYCLNEFLDNILPVIADCIINPVFPEKELQIFSGQNKQDLLKNVRMFHFLQGKNSLMFYTEMIILWEKWYKRRILRRSKEKIYSTFIANITIWPIARYVYPE
ncbi:MAG: insulinase family protein [Flavobacteriales bacterium]